MWPQLALPNELETSPPPSTDLEHNEMGLLAPVQDVPHGSQEHFVWVFNGAPPTYGGFRG